MKGRKPMPTRLKLLLSNQRKPPPGPQFAPGCTRPEWLSGYALEEWNVVAPELLERGVLCRVDTAMLGGYCAAVGVYRQAVEDIEASGLTYITPAGLVKKNPAVSIALACVGTMRQLGAEFGLSPVSRARLPHSTAGADAFDQFLKIPNTGTAAKE
jgi:P27 family predicted phage terminase small subunit